MWVFRYTPEGDLDFQFPLRENWQPTFKESLAKQILGFVIKSWWL